MSRYSATVLGDSPIGYWRFGEISGDAQDSSGYGREGIVAGAPTYRASGLLAGDPDTALKFTGAANQRVYFSAAVLPTLPAWSMEFWIKGGASTSRQFDRIWSNNSQFEISHDYLVTNTLGYLDGTGWANAVALAIGETAHFVWTFDGTNLSVFKNGVLAYGPIVRGRGLTNGGSNIGGAATEVVTDTIDEYAIYDHALTAAQALAHYRAGTLLPVTKAQIRALRWHKQVAVGLGYGRSTLKHRALAGTLSAPSATGVKVYTPPFSTAVDETTVDQLVWFIFQQKLPRTGASDDIVPGKTLYENWVGQFPVINDSLAFIVFSDEDWIEDNQPTPNRYKLQNPAIDTSMSFVTCELERLR